jgi:uncharacterized ferritin-like protein (DUF455 family)
MHVKHMLVAPAPCTSAMLRSGSVGGCMQVQMVEPKKMRRLGKGGTLQSRQAIVHSLVNIESWAVDLSWWVDNPRH